MPNRKPYCDVHQKWCTVCLSKDGSYVKHLKSEACPRCKGAKVLDDQRQAQEERAKKDKDVADKIAKEKSGKAKKAGGKVRN